MIRREFIMNRTNIRDAQIAREDAILNIDNSSPKSRELIEKAYGFSGLFGDMLFDEDSITGHFRLLADGEYKELPDELEQFNYYDMVGFEIGSLCSSYLGRYDIVTRTLTFTEEGAKEDYVMLRELIHVHEHLLDDLPESHRDIVMFSLKKELSQEIKNLDDMIMKYNAYFIATDPKNRCTLHSTIFMLKSLDLDMKKEDELGTVFGHNGFLKEFLVKNEN